jgi:D-alanyl-D-alanine carboxypeptidase (penicillin-binding protein 5/6)
VGKFKRGDREIIIAIMGSNTMWADIKTLVEYGFSTQPMVADTPKKSIKTKLIAGIPEVRR